MSAQEPVFLTREGVDCLHAESLARYGGMAGVRDDGLVDSAIGAAENTWFYGGGDLFNIAAAYALSRRRRRSSMGTSAPQSPRPLLFSNSTASL